MGVDGEHDEWGYEEGKPYRTRQARTPDDWLDAALHAERYVARFRHEDENGVWWDNPDGGAPTPGYPDAVSGIMYFYIQLARVTGDPRFHREAEQSARWVLAHWNNSRPEQGTPLEGFDSCLGNMLLEAYRTFGDKTYADAARAFANQWVESSTPGAHGPKWTGNTAWAKDGGIILFLLNLGRTLDDRTILDFTARAGEQYLSEGETGADGRIVFDGKLGGTAEWEGVVFHMDYNMPNWEFGAAGSGYILLALHELTGDPRYVKAAEDQLAYLRSVAVPQTKGVLIPRTLAPDESDVFYIGHCHGIAGTGKFLHLLDKTTGTPDAKQLIIDLADGAESVGAPERMSKGLWNIDTLCCGHAGLAHYFTGLYLAYGEERWHDLAIRCGNVLLGMREEQDDGSWAWPIAFWRVKPQDITRPHTLFRGAAGIATALLELYMLETGSYTWDRLIDDPFPAHWHA